MELECTPSQLESHERRKLFHQAIAKRAAEISPEAQLRALVVAPPPAPKPPLHDILPPIDNAAIADASDIVAPVWIYDVKRIRAAVALEFGVPEIDIMSHRRTARVVLPRQVAMYLCRKITRRSLPDIAKKFGNRDHSTVIHAVEKIERMMAGDLAFKARVHAIAESVGGSL